MANRDNNNRKNNLLTYRFFVIIESSEVVIIDTIFLDVRFSIQKRMLISSSVLVLYFSRLFLMILLLLRSYLSSMLSK